MTKIIENNVAELIMVGVISLILMTSCKNNETCSIEYAHIHNGEMYYPPTKACCIKTECAVYEYEGLTTDDIE